MLRRTGLASPWWCENDVDAMPVWFRWSGKKRGICERSMLTVQLPNQGDSDGLIA